MQSGHGYLIRVLDKCTDQAMNIALVSMDLTAAQGHIMCFITHRKTPPCARDVEEAFQLSHPTVSGILSRLEQKGFIQLRPDENDRRCKRIYLLEKGRELDETMHRTMENTEQQLVRGFTEEERQQFADLLQRALDNLGGHPCKRKHKEESQV